MWEKVHPVRAALAVVTMVATVAMLFLAVEIPDAWWAIVGAVGMHYFDGSNG